MPNMVYPPWWYEQQNGHRLRQQLENIKDTQLQQQAQQQQAQQQLAQQQQAQQQQAQQQQVQQQQVQQQQVQQQQATVTRSMQMHRGFFPFSTQVMK